MSELLTASEFEALRQKVARRAGEAERQRETIEAWMKDAHRKERNFIIREYRRALRQHRKALQLQRG
jgi:hypothetical protein